MQLKLREERKQLGNGCWTLRCSVLQNESSEKRNEYLWRPCYGWDTRNRVFFLIDTATLQSNSPSFW